MNEEQLNVAAAEHCKAMSEIPAVNSYHAFKAGARWHESLPLADRLSESEKKRIRYIYNHYDDEYKDEDSPSTNYTFALEKALESIFGSILFNPTEQ